MGSSIISQPNFTFRVGGILQKDNKILFQRNKKGDAWVLPGGRAEVHETSIETIVREFNEELGVQIHVSRLICIIENFSAYEYEGLHEFGMYYLVASDEEISVHDSDFKGIEKSVKLTFRWISINEIGLNKIYPKVLKDILINIPIEAKHYINNDKEN